MPSRHPTITGYVPGKGSSYGSATRPRALPKLQKHLRGFFEEVTIPVRQDTPDITVDEATEFDAEDHFAASMKCVTVQTWKVLSLDSFDFKAIPSLNKLLVTELACCEYVERRENIIALGPICSCLVQSPKAMRYRQIACCPGAWTGRLPKGAQSAFHHSICHGARTDGGA